MTPEEFEDGIENISKVFETDDLIKEITEEYLAEFKLSFEDGGGHTKNSEGGWTPKKDGSASYLTGETKNLKNSLQSIIINNNSAEIKSDIIYAAIHNEGLQPKGWSKPMPKREFLGYPTDDFNTKIEEIIINKLNNQ